MKKPKNKAKTKKLFLTPAKSDLFAAALIITLIVATYAGSLRNSFQFDDIPRIIHNQKIQDLSSLKAEYPFLRGKRAVVNYTLWLNYRLGGHKSSAETVKVKDSLFLNTENYSAWRYHAFNILVHCVNGVLAYFLIVKMLALIKWTANEFQERAVALGAALLFGLHPVQTQAVTYIIQRAELLSAFFQFVALLCYIAGRTKEKMSQRIIFLVPAVISYLLALESKEQAVIFPLVIVLFELLILKSGRKNRLPAAAAFMAVMLLLTAIFLHNLSFTYMGDTAAGFDIKGISKGHYALTNFRVIFTYLRLLILPVNQNLDYDYPISASFISPPATLLAFIVLLGIVGLAIAIAKKQPLYSFCIFFFLITLAPSSGFIPIVDVIFEHRLYLPCLGVFLMIALFVEKLYLFMKQKNIIQRNAIIGAVSVLLAISCVAATIRRNLIWRTPLTLWQDVIVKSPNKARGYMNLGHEQFNYYRKMPQAPSILPEAKRYLDKAFANFEKSIELDPKQPDTYANLSLVFLELDRGDEAIAVLELAIKLDAENPDRYLKLADMYYRLGRQKQAVEYFESIFIENKVLKQRFVKHDKLRDAMAKTYLALGVGCEVNDSGERYGAGFPVEKAVAAYEKSLEWEPLAETYYSLAVVLDRSGDTKRSLINYRKVLELKPGFQYADIVRNRIKDIESQN